MQTIRRVLPIVGLILLSTPESSMADSIVEAGKRQAMAVRLRQTQAAPVLWRSTRAPRLRAIQIGAAVGCGAIGYLGFQFGAECNQQFRGLIGGCLGGAVFGAAIGYVVSAR